MARDGGKIEIKIGADASELEQELSKASKALASTTTNAAKMGDTVDDAADDMKASAKKMGDLSSSAENTKDEFGELSSGMGALATALDMVDPRLGAAARGMGDLAGASEGAIRLTKLKTGALASLLPAVSLVGVAVAGLAAGYLFLKRDLDAANASVLASEERLRRVLPLYGQVKMATMMLQVAQGDRTAESVAEMVIREEGQQIFREEIDLQKEAVAGAREEWKQKLETRDAARLAAAAFRDETGARLAMLPAQRAMAELAFAAERRAERREDDARSELMGLHRSIDTMEHATSVYIEARVETERLNAASEDTPPILEEAAAPVEALADRYQTFAENVGKAVEALEGLTRSNADTMAAMRAQGDAVAENTRKEELAVRASRENAQKRIDGLRTVTEEGLALVVDDVAARERMEASLAAMILSIQTTNGAEVAEIRRHYADEEREIIQGQVDAFDAGERAKTKAATDEATRRRDQKFEDYQSDLSMAQEVTGQLADLGQARLDLFLQNAGRMTAITKEEADNMTEAERQAANAQIALNRDAALKMWRQNKALAIAEAAQLALEASLRAFAQNAANPIYAGIVSGLAFAIATAKGAMIASSPPPFQEGGMVPGVGAVPITAHGGEGVLTEQTTRAIGGKSGIDALNRGDIGGQLQTLISLTERQVSGASSGSQVIEMRYKHKVLDTVIKDQLRTGSALKRAIRGGSRIGHS